jgi:predicted ATPase/DNA-binding SARP family transcriptional activator
MLALLTLRHGRPVERDWLAGTLWPDVLQSQASASLRAVLSELRVALGTEGGRLQSPNRPTLLLDLAGAWADVLTFDTAAARGDIASLTEAVALYRGPLLEGITEEWVAQERTAREAVCLRALQTLANAAADAGKPDEAVALWQRAVSMAPLWDAARRGLMMAFAAEGDTNSALQVYREFVNTLQGNDPRAVPDHETTTLYNHLRTEARQRANAPALPIREESATPAPVVTGYLPHSLTELVGREDECDEVAALLRRARLVTMTGPGGIGKTRLAVAVAEEVVHEYPDGVWLVALDTLSDPALVAQVVARILGVQEQPHVPLRQTLVASLKDKRLLLVLDNCEHLTDACARLTGDLLQECRSVRILTTSRETLGITGEAIWTIPPLAVPDPDHLPEGRATLVRVLVGYDGVRLFVERAQAVQKTFALTGSNAEAVARLCSRLEGVPLAIELAAARVRSMTVEQIADRLSDHFSGYLGLLTGGSRNALSRQRTLRAALDWSYDLLSEQEQALLRRLSVFAGGWTLEAAEEVVGGALTLGSVVSEGEAGEPHSPQYLSPTDHRPKRKRATDHSLLDLLSSLVDKSLVAFDERAADGAGRYRLLEMMRQYASEKLQGSGEAGVIQARHAEWFLAFAEETEKQNPLLQEAEHDNLRAALRWCLTEARAAEMGLRLASAMARFWYRQGLFNEGSQWMTQALERSEAQGRTEARAKALRFAGALYFYLGDYAIASPYFEESLDIYRQFGDGNGITFALNNLGNIAHVHGEFATARQHFEESLQLAREADDQLGISWALDGLGTAVRSQGDFASARAFMEESVEISRQQGEKYRLSGSLASLGTVFQELGDDQAARACFEESMQLFRERGDRHGMAFTLTSLGIVMSDTGDYDASGALFEESLRLTQKLGDKLGIARSLYGMGKLAFRRGDFAAAQMVLTRSLELFQEIGDREGIALTQDNLGRVACAQGRYAEARALHRASLPFFQDSKNRAGIADFLQGTAAALLGLGEVKTAARLLGAAGSIIESYSLPLRAPEKARYDASREEARAAMLPEEFTTAWSAGRALNWEQAVELALRDDV